MINNLRYAALTALFLVLLVLIIVLNAYVTFQSTVDLIAGQELPLIGFGAAARTDMLVERLRYIEEEITRRDTARNWASSGSPDPSPLFAELQSALGKYGVTGLQVYIESAGIVHCSGGAFRPFREGIDLGASSRPAFGAVAGSNGSCGGHYIRVPVPGPDGGSAVVIAAFVGADFLAGIFDDFLQNPGFEVYLADSDGGIFYPHSGISQESPDDSEAASRNIGELWGPDFSERLRREHRNAGGIVYGGTGFGQPLVWGAYIGEWDFFVVLSRDARTVRAAADSAVARSVFTGLALVVFFALLSYFAKQVIERELKWSQAQSKLLARRFRAIITAMNQCQIRLETMLKESAEAASHPRDEFAGRLRMTERQNLQNLRLALLETVPDRGFAQSNSAESESDLAAVVRDILLHRTPQAASRGLSLIDRIPEGPIAVNSDRSLLFFCLDTLFGHVLSSAQEGSEILAAVAVLERGVRVDLSAIIPHAKSAGADSAGSAAGSPTLSMIAELLSAEGATFETSAGPGGCIVWTVGFSAGKRA